MVKRLAWGNRERLSPDLDLLVPESRHWQPPSQGLVGNRSWCGRGRHIWKGTEEPELASRCKSPAWWGWFSSSPRTQLAAWTQQAELRGADLGALSDLVPLCQPFDGLASVSVCPLGPGILRPVGSTLQEAEGPVFHSASGQPTLASFQGFVDWPLEPHWQRRWFSLFFQMVSWWFQVSFC